MFLSSGFRYVGEIPKLHQGCQVPFHVSGGNVVFLSRHCFGKGPHLALRGESRGFSRVRAVGLGFLSSCDGDFRDPLVLPQKIQVSFRVARGRLGFLSSWCRGLEPHLKLRRETQGSSPALKGIRGSYGDYTGESDVVSCWGMELHFPLEVEKGCQASCGVEVGISGYF